MSEQAGVEDQRARAKRLLTDRQYRAWQLAESGLGYKRIAMELGISSDSARDLIARAKTRLGDGGDRGVPAVQGLSEEVHAHNLRVTMGRIGLEGEQQRVLMAALEQATEDEIREWKGLPLIAEVRPSDPAFIRQADISAVVDVRTSGERFSDRAYQHEAKRRARKRETSVEPVSRAEIIERDKSTCYLCGKVCKPDEIHLDHIVPLAKGGTHTRDNLGIACADCNHRKGAALTDKRPVALR